MLGQSLCVLWNFEIGPGLHRSNSLRISAIGLNFNGMMHSNMEQITIKNDHAPPILSRSTKLWNFQERQGPSPRDDVTALTLLSVSPIGLEFKGDDAQYHEADRHVKKPCSANLCVFHGPLNFSIIGFWARKMKLKKSHYGPKRHDAVYYESGHSMKWPHSYIFCIFWSRPAEGPVVLWTYCYRNEIHVSINDCFGINKILVLM